MARIAVTALSEVNFAPASERDEVVQNVRTILATRVGTVPLDRDFGFRRDPSEWEDRYVSRYTFREKETGQVEDETISLIYSYGFSKGFVKNLI